MQDGTFKVGNRTQRTGNSSTSTFIQHRHVRHVCTVTAMNHARKYSHSNESCTYVQSKQANKELPPNKCLLFTHTVTYTSLLNETAPHMHLYKKQRKATPKDKGGRQVRGPNVTWSLDDRPGPRDRRVLPAPSWRDGGQAATSTLHQHLSPGTRLGR